eukprot:3204920-Prymnesium_polylepis.1
MANAIIARAHRHSALSLHSVCLVGSHHVGVNMITGRSAARVDGSVLSLRAPSPHPRSDGSERARTQPPGGSDSSDSAALGRSGCT